MQLLKMCALIEGKPTTVGQCHPGQARLLQKKGLAEFREGKLWLNEPPAPIEGAGQSLVAQGGLTKKDGRTLQEQVDHAIRDPEAYTTVTYGHPQPTDQSILSWTKALADSLAIGGTFENADDPFARLIGVHVSIPGRLPTVHRIPLTLTKEDWPEGTPFSRLQWERYVREGRVDTTLLSARYPFKVTFYVPSKEEQDEILQEAGIEPGEWQDQIQFQGGHSRQSDYEVQSYATLLREYLQRTGLGHRLCSHEDVGRNIGFLDMGDDVGPPTYVCTPTRGRDIHMIPADVTAAFQMSAEQIATLLRTKEGREQLFGVWGWEDVDAEEVDWIDDDIWQSATTLPPEELAAVGNGAVEPVLLPIGEPGETPADRAAAIARVRAKQAKPPRRVKGWTSFRWPDAFQAIPVCTPAPDAVGGKLPFPHIPETVVHATADGYAGFPIVKYGVYRRVKDRLFRVWTEGGWDESTLQEDGTYLLQSQNQRVDAFIVGSGMDIDILAPSGFEGCLEEAEARIAEVSNGS